MAVVGLLPWYKIRYVDNITRQVRGCGPIQAGRANGPLGMPKEGLTGLPKIGGMAEAFFGGPQANDSSGKD